MLRDSSQADPVGVDVVPGGQAGQHHAAAVIREQVTIPVLIHVLRRRIAKTLADLQILRFKCSKSVESADVTLLSENI